MQLVSVRLSGYRRFVQTQTVALGPKVVAFVGPNNTGKTWFLKALAGINDSGWHDGDSPAGDAHADVRPSLSALFLLDDDDRRAISHLPGAEKVTAYIAEKHSNGDLAADLVPPVQPDQAMRLATRRLLLEEHADVVKGRLSEGLFGALRDVLSRDLDVLESKALQIVSGGLAALQGEADDKRDADAADEAPSPGSEDVAAAYAALKRFRDFYSDNSLVAIQRALVEREPPVLFYDAAARQLEGHYSLTADDDPPEPIADLLKVAGSSFGDVKTAFAAGNRRHLFTLQERINRRLAALFALYWRQDELTIEINVVQDELLIYVKHRRSGAYSELDEHSQGFRSFLALLAFTASRTSTDSRPVLLIDEAELHLHYDAQSALVDMLQRQDFASKVLYTTHSAGCLPDDLGGSVRQIRATGSETSEILGSVWQNEFGVNPLMLALGASTFAFGAVRKAVFVEGPSDAILLPALFAGASGNDALGFQVVPGLAWLRVEAMAHAADHAGTAVFLTDGDTEGDTIRKRLSEAGVADERLFKLAHEGGPCVLEDLIVPDALVYAVNTLLRTSGRNDVQLEAVDLDDPAGQAQALGRWFSQHEIAPVAKPLVAQEMVRWSQPFGEPRRPLLRGAAEGALLSLLGTIREVLGVEISDQAEAGLLR